MTDEKKEKTSPSELEETKVRTRDSGKPNLATLEATLAEKEEEIRSCIDRLKRLQAEFENYKKRTQRDMESLEERTSNREILDFLPLYDNMERAFTSYSGNNDAVSFIEGIERILAQFDQLLEQKSVSSVEALGLRFDPAKHEALLSVESDKDEHVILEEFERGYLRNGRLLRPSKVKVSKGRHQTEEERS